MKAHAIGKTLTALLAGVLASFIAVRWLDARADAHRRDPADAMSSVVVAAEDIAAGRALSAAQLKRMDWPTAALPPEFVGSTDELIGRVTRARLVAGEPVLTSRLAPAGSRAGVSSLIAPGMRAMSVSLSELGGLEADALEGARVDVIVNASEGSGERARSVSRVVLERIRVLTLSGGASAGSRGFAVTLEVTPEQAEKLDLARNVGRLSVVLRSQTDAEGGAARGATRDSLFGQTPDAQAAVQPPVTRALALREPPRPSVARPAAATPPSAPSATPIATASAPTPRRTCVETLIGSDRRQECF